MTARRRLAGLLVAALACSTGVARAQRRAQPVRLGYLTGADASDPNLGHVRMGLRRITWSEGREFTLATRFAELDYDRFPTLLDELLRERIDILITAGPATRLVPIAQHAVPIVFAFSGDPVAARLVQSFSRPGGNATGVTLLSYELAAKRVEFLRALAPTARRAAVLWNPAHPGEQEELRITSAAAERLGFETFARPVHGRSEVTAALDAAEAAGCDTLICFPSPVTLANRDTIVERTARHKWPGIFGRREFTDAGGLFSFGPHIGRTYQRVAYYVERIAAGVPPSQLPVEAAPVIETVANRRAAELIGVQLQASLLLRADEVIE